MSTSLLYHAFGMKGYTYRKTRYEKGKMVFEIERNLEKLQCPVCGSGNVILKGKKNESSGHCR